MHRTTIYLPEELRQAVRTVARDSGTSEAVFIRQAVSKAVNDVRAPRPRLPLFSSKDPTLAERVDEELSGFGER